MALTLRPTVEQQQLLEKVQVLFGESTITKAIYACCTEYIRLRSSHAKLEQDNAALQRRYDELLSSTNQYISAQDHLRATVLHQQK